MMTREVLIWSIVCVWVTCGLIQWLTYPHLEFSWYDFFVALPVITLLWPFTIGNGGFF